ncbi:MAG: hypothetical protein ACREBI_12140 [Nitrosotalea sp.]
MTSETHDEMHKRHNDERTALRLGHHIARRAFEEAAEREHQRLAKRHEHERKGGSARSPDQVLEL